MLSNIISNWWNRNISDPFYQMFFGQQPQTPLYIPSLGELNVRPTPELRTPQTTVEEKPIDEDQLPNVNIDDTESTKESTENVINSWDEHAQKLKEEYWAREDAIRKETQEREDSAYQRMISDMRKSGINPNLIMAQPSSSGGGITQASRQDNFANTEMQVLAQILLGQIQNDTTINQKEKDRISELIGNIMQGLSSLGGASIIAKATGKK